MRFVARITNIISGGKSWIISWMESKLAMFYSRKYFFYCSSMGSPSLLRLFSVRIRKIMGRYFRCLDTFSLYAAFLRFFVSCLMRDSHKFEKSFINYFENERYNPWSRSTMSKSFGLRGFWRIRMLPGCASQCTKPCLKIMSANTLIRVFPTSSGSKPICFILSFSLILTPYMKSMTINRCEQ